MKSKVAETAPSCANLTWWWWHCRFPAGHYWCSVDDCRHQWYTLAEQWGSTGARLLQPPFFDMPGVSLEICMHLFHYMAMDQYLLIPFLVGWTSIYQLFWCSPGVQGFDTLPYVPKYDTYEWSCQDKHVWKQLPGLFMSMSSCKLTHVVSSAILAPDGQRFIPSPMPQVSFAPMHLISAYRQLWTLWTPQIGCVGKLQEKPWKTPTIHWLIISKTRSKRPEPGDVHHCHMLRCGPLACMVAVSHISHAETLCPLLTDIQACLLHFQISFQTRSDTTTCHYQRLGTVSDLNSPLSSRLVSTQLLLPPATTWTQNRVRGDHELTAANSLAMIHL